MAYDRIQGIRRSVSGGVRRILGHTSSGIKLLGRTNNHFKSLGISNPVIDKGIGAMEKYGLPTIDFLQNELSGGDEENNIFYFYCIIIDI